MSYESASPTRDDGPDLIDVTTRPGYNAAIIDEAIASLTDRLMDREDDEEDDEELGAQIAICQGRTGPEQDAAVDHLRQLLLISYADLEDLPRPIPARQLAPLAEAPAVGELRALLTEGQRAALRQAAQAIVDTSPEDDEVAAFEVILFALDDLDGVL
jgi:hypothetical protein